MPVVTIDRRVELERLREELFQARASGVREVRDSNGETIRYGTDAEMARALAMIDAELSPRAANTIHFSTSKGLDR